MLHTGGDEELYLSPADSTIRLRNIRFFSLSNNNSNSNRIRTKYETLRISVWFYCLNSKNQLSRIRGSWHVMITAFMMESLPVTRNSSYGGILYDWSPLHFIFPKYEESFISHFKIKKISLKKNIRAFNRNYFHLNFSTVKILKKLLDWFF